jgi:hypothetical protein
MEPCTIDDCDLYHCEACSRHVAPGMTECLDCIEAGDASDPDAPEPDSIEAVRVSLAYLAESLESRSAEDIARAFARIDERLEALRDYDPSQRRYVLVPSTAAVEIHRSWDEATARQKALLRSGSPHSLIAFPKQGDE